MPRQDRSPMLRLEALEIRTNPSSNSIESGPPQDGQPADPEIVLVQSEDSSTAIDSSQSGSESSAPDDKANAEGASSAEDSGTPFETTIEFVSDRSSSESSATDGEAKSDPASDPSALLAMTIKEEGATADSSETKDSADPNSQTGIFTFTSQSAEDTTGNDQQGSPSQNAEDSSKDDGAPTGDETKRDESSSDPSATDDLNGGDVDPVIYQTSVISTPKPMTLSQAEVNRLSGGFVESREFAQNMVQAAFLKYLGRLAEQKGLDAWANALMSGQIDSTDMIVSIAASQENLANAGFNAHKLFQDLYQNALGRDADAAGLGEWVRTLFVATGKKLGLGNDQILALYQADQQGHSNQAFLGSPAGLQSLRESVTGLLHTAEFRRYTVRTVYGGILDRTAAEREIQAWSQYLAAGHGQEDLVRQFVQSGEYRAQFRSPRAFLTGLYGDLLFRAPDAQGFLAMAGTFGANGQFHSDLDPELNQYYQELLVDAQTMNVPPYELLQDDLDEAYSIRVEGFKPENLQFIADNNPGFSLGLLGSFIHAVAPAQLTAGIDFSDGSQVYAFLRDHGDELAEELGDGSEQPSSADFDLAKWMEAMPEQGEEMFAWLKSLYYQSIPQRIAKFLPPADLAFDWTQFFPGGINGIAPGEPNGEQDNDGSSASDDTHLAGSDSENDEKAAA